jgi:CrcB protein
MRDLLLVFAGGGTGSIVRYLLGRWVNGYHISVFPLGTMAVNIVACVVLGAVVALADERQILSPATRLLLAVGFCGGFSTFSSYSLETYQLLQKGEYAIALGYMAGSILLCLMATVAGMWAVRQVI